MATDGVKIIDSDLARDTYNQIMDLYDSDASIECIRTEIPFVKRDHGFKNEFYHEIFVTAYALAFWEIGEVTIDIIQEVERVIQLKAGVAVWNKEYDEIAGTKRQKELDNLLKKISQPNPKVRKRKKYRIVTNFYFQPDDVLAFQLSDGNYCALICAKVTQQRGNCSYDLVATTYKSRIKPTIDVMKACFIAGRRISSGFDPNITLSDQPGVDEIWQYTEKSNFYFGLPYDLVTHKDMISLKDKFEVVGKLRIKESFKKDGSYGYQSSFDDFERIFADLERHFKAFDIQKYPVTLLCEL